MRVLNALLTASNHMAQDSHQLMASTLPVAVAG